MNSTTLLIANRGEIAIRIIRAAAELGMRTVAVFAEDDANSLHIKKADQAIPLNGSGAGAYLDIEQVIAAAQQTDSTAIHPGYGFLSENTAFALRCTEEGITFIGPRADILEMFGNKTQARALAERCEVPLLPGTSGSTNLEDARSFLESLGDGGAIMIKALAGGGGRGMRAVQHPGEIEQAYQRCQSEAQAAFGNGDVYVEQFIPRARHIEIQIIGDQGGNVSHLWERECSIQRRHQKIVEIAPSPGLSAELRDQLIAAALRLAEEVHYDNLGTFEFLVDSAKADNAQEATSFAFIEANPRLQVEHTVTEAITGVDLVKTQLQLALGSSLSDLGLRQVDITEPRGFAVQARINLETMTADGDAKPSGGTLTAFEPPSGPGIRVDTFGYPGYTTSPRYDSLLAKLIGYSTSVEFADAVTRTYRALCEFNIEGVKSNIGFLQNLLKHPEFIANHTYTRFIEDHIDELVDSNNTNIVHQKLFFEQSVPVSTTETSVSAKQPAAKPLGLAGARVDNIDPLAVLDHGKTAIDRATTVDYLQQDSAADNTTRSTEAIKAPLQGTIVSIDVEAGEVIHAEQQLLVMEAMKMEHVISANINGIVRQLLVAQGDAVFEDHALVILEEADVDIAKTDEQQPIDLDAIRPDLAETFDRHGLGLDENRPEAVAKRRKTNHRTARENINDLCDAGTFVEYGPLTIAAQRQRRSVDDLMKNTPGDGMVTGIGSVNGEFFKDEKAQCILMSYDYTVLAGTQGQQNHRKKDRMFELAEQWQLPVVVFTEGGGGRPGDTDGLWVAGLDCFAFNYFARLSGLVPIVGITSGRCFAGNAVLLGCCDVIIATADANIGMGGPAMIEGGGLGVFRPEEVGPMSDQVPNGVVDIPVKDEAEAVQVAKKYLSYFQGPIDDWSCPDQRLLRTTVPENRLRIYDVREVIETLADTDSVLELRRHFGLGMVTSFIRVEGRPLGVIANNPTHLAGAVTSEGADKAARFMQLCDAFDIPILLLCDTPGMMVGPESEKTALVRHSCRLFVTGANLTVPFFTIVLRKSYGLGAQAMAGGSFKTPFFTVSWPTGEFGGMGLEGAVKLGYRKELAALEDPQERKALYEEMVEEMYNKGKALNAATYFEFDDVIDPMESRRWILNSLRSVPKPEPRKGKKRPCVDTW